MRAAARQQLHLLPELGARGLADHELLAHPAPVLVDHQRLGRLQASPIAGQDGVADRGGAHQPGAPRQQRARRQPQEIEHERHLGGLVEIVDAPHQPALGVAPGAEILQVDVADREHGGRIGQLGTAREHRLRQAQVDRAQEAERAVAHDWVLGLEIGFDEGVAEPFGEPAFVVAHRATDARHDTGATPGGGSNAVTGGASALRSTCTSTVWATDDCPSFELPPSLVTRLGLPCLSSVPGRPGSSGSYHAPVAICTTPGRRWSTIRTPARNAPRSLNTRTTSPSVRPRAAASARVISSGSRPATLAARLSRAGSSWLCSRTTGWLDSRCSG